ncbi:MAG: glycosyltransferase family 2 protein [bacterium]|nr:glycosyltransferase family 2 protein [bacterium]
MDEQPSPRPGARPAYSVVVPFFNEERSCRLLHERLKKVMDSIGGSYELIFVDDGSADRTPDILREIFRADPAVKVIRLRRNFGQTAALAAGFDEARGDVVISMDGDLQHDPEDIRRLLDKMREGYDIVSGWRKERKDLLVTRRIPSWAANAIMRRLSGVPIRDFGTTLKAYKRSVIKGVKLTGELHRFIPALASDLGARITEIPIANVNRPHGKSHYGLWRTTGVLLDIITVKFFLSYSRTPMRMFGSMGLVALLFGFCFGLYEAAQKIVFGRSIGKDALVQLSVLLIILGFQFISLGLLGEMISRIYFETRGRRIYDVDETWSHGGAPGAAG